MFTPANCTQQTASESPTYKRSGAPLALATGARSSASRQQNETSSKREGVGRVRVGGRKRRVGGMFSLPYSKYEGITQATLQNVPIQGRAGPGHGSPVLQRLFFSIQRKPPINFSHSQPFENLRLIKRRVINGCVRRHMDRLLGFAFSQRKQQQKKRPGLSTHISPAKSHAFSASQENK